MIYEQLLVGFVHCDYVCEFKLTTFIYNFACNIYVNLTMVKEINVRCECNNVTIRHCYLINSTLETKLTNLIV